MFEKCQLNGLSFFHPNLIRDESFLFPRSAFDARDNFRLKLVDLSTLCSRARILDMKKKKKKMTQMQHGDGRHTLYGE